MPRIGTPLSPSATRVLLCGAGELGKELVIELQRLGVEVIAVDRYANAPAMQVAHRCHVINMLDGAALRAVIELEQPHYIVPEIEAIATATLVELENEGFTVIPWLPKNWVCRRRHISLPTPSSSVVQPSRPLAFPA
jgi:phosphoribosylglycinamide formyltransferase 2